MRKTEIRNQRAAQCYELLQALSRHALPVVCSDAEVVHQILALHSASLLRALAEPATVLRNGERRTGRAIVMAITPEGRAVCLACAAQQAVPRRRN